MKEAKYLIGKSRRKDATQKVLESQKIIKNKMSNIDYNIESLKKQRLNYL